MLKATILAILMVTAAGSAVAQEHLHRAVQTAQQTSPTKPSKVVSKVHQPIGTPHKASSFAPRHTNKRVYGDPIQAPIVHSAPPPK